MTDSNVQKFLEHVGKVRLMLQLPVSNYSQFKQNLSYLRRKRVLALLLLLSTPYLYGYLRRRYLASRFYRAHRQRNISFAQHLKTAESGEVDGKGGKDLKRSGKSSNRVNVDGEFMQKLQFLIRIVIPGWRSKEALMLMLHSLFLIARTYLSVVVARIDGSIVKELVAGNSKGFLRGLGLWFAIAVPATYTNSMIRYLQSKLAIAFRTRLTTHVHDMYLNNLVYYKLMNLDSRISGPDQLICTDIARFCDTLASLYSNLAKPVLDTVIFNYQLTKSIGLAGMLALFVNYMITARILRSVTPGFGKLAAVEAKLEGDFRGAHSRLITNAEEIAFYHGSDRELGILDSTYRTLMRHVNRIYRIRIFYNMFEDFIVKYSWSAVGLLVCSVPVFFPSWAGSRERRMVVEGSNAPIEDEPPSISTSSTASGLAALSDSSSEPQQGSRTQGFVTNKRLMISLADAGGRIMYSYKELSELAGFTSRVYDLLYVFRQLQDNIFEKKMISDNPFDYEDEDEGDQSGKWEFSLDNLQGITEIGYPGIRMTKVPVVTPSGDLLINDMSFDLQKGMHVLITGPNGVGKSAIMRIIAGLWPVFRGIMEKPADREIIYIPQRPYLSLGTLRDQVIYPQTAKDLKNLGKKDEELMEILKIVHLDYLPEREGGWDTQKEWKDVLSGGEKQRMNLARLFFHRPLFAVLDECTSAVSTDVEGLMYSTAKDMGISLLTISHKPSLLKHHEYQLKIKGAGVNGSEWEWVELTEDNARMSVDNEMAMLSDRIGEEDRMKRRITEINKLLGVKVNAVKK